jgi:hypothetical protein
VNPHLIIYDATVLVLPLIWFGAYVQEEPRHAIAPAYWKTVCWLFAALFVPTSAFIGVQVSVLLMAWMLVLIKRAALAPGESGLALRAA